MAPGPQDGPGPVAAAGAPDARERWLAALAYAGPLVLWVFWRDTGHPFLRWHLRQGFALFFVEVVLLALVLLLDHTVGQIPILGWLLMLLVRLAGFLAVLTASVVGFVKALAGEDLRLPWLAEQAERVPLPDVEDRS